MTSSSGISGLGVAGLGVAGSVQSTSGTLSSMGSRDFIERVRVSLRDEAASKVSDETIISSGNAVIQTLWHRASLVNPGWVRGSTIIKTGANSRSVALPDDFLRLTRLEYTADHSKLDEWHWKEEPEWDTASQPWKYRVDGLGISFPHPADAEYSLTLTYDRTCTAMAIDDTLSPLPAAFDNVIVERTAKKLGADLDREELERDEMAALHSVSHAEPSRPTGYKRSGRRRGFR